MSIIVVGTNLCAPDKKRKRSRGLGEVADRKAYNVHAINIISSRQYFVARYLSSHVGNDAGFYTQYVRLFSICPQLVT